MAEASESGSAAEARARPWTAASGAVEVAELPVECGAGWQAVVELLDADRGRFDDRGGVGLELQDSAQRGDACEILFAA